MDEDEIEAAHLSQTVLGSATVQCWQARSELQDGDRESQDKLGAHSADQDSVGQCFLVDARGLYTAHMPTRAPMQRLRDCKGCLRAHVCLLSRLRGRLRQKIARRFLPARALQCQVNHCLTQMQMM